MSDKISLNPLKLPIKDLKRARAGPLQGRDPVELFSDSLERMTLIIWCHRSRYDPEFTWSDAEEEAPELFEEFEAAEGEEEERPPDPPGASPGEPDARPASAEQPSSAAKPRRRAPSTSSGSSSGSPEPSTTT